MCQPSRVEHAFGGVRPAGVVPLLGGEIVQRPHRSTLFTRQGLLRPQRLVECWSAAAATPPALTRDSVRAAASLAPPLEYT